MDDKTILAEKATHSYTVCFHQDCPLSDHCLRHLVGKHAPATLETCTSVNPNAKGTATKRCPHYRTSQKQKMAQGMKNIFNDNMPQRVEKGVRQELIRRTNRQYYYEYRSGVRLIPPAMQEEIRELFRQLGWTEEIHFDNYTEQYNW